MIPFGRESSSLKNLLFICGKGRQRSPTAEQVFANYSNVETDSAGLSADADLRLGTDQIEWSTHIIVMEKSQASKLRTNYKKYIDGKKIICLDIPDKFDYMQIELIELLKQRIRRVL